MSVEDEERACVRASAQVRVCVCAQVRVCASARKRVRERENERRGEEGKTVARKIVWRRKN